MIVLGLREVHVCDSGGTQALVDMRDRQLRTGRHVWISRLTTPVRCLLELTGVAPDFLQHPPRRRPAPGPVASSVAALVLGRRLTPDAVHVTSSGIDPEGWTPLPEDTAAMVDLPRLGCDRGDPDKPHEASTLSPWVPMD